MSEYSVNETAIRAKLAAKGVGYSWGMAEEVSRVVAWLVQRGLPGPELLVQLLEQYPTVASVKDSVPVFKRHQLTPSSVWLCPLASGCALSDLYAKLDSSTQVVISDVKFPLLMLPFVAELALRSQTTLTLQFDDMSIATDGCKHRYSNPAIVSITQTGSLVCTVAENDEDRFNHVPNQVLISRVIVNDGVWERLGEYAQRTYAPATDASRALGAGAGLSDND